MRLLTVSNLFPRPDDPTRGLFNAQFFDALTRRPVTPGGSAETAEIENLCLVPCWQLWRWRAIRKWRSPRAAPYPTRYVPVFYVPVVGRDLSWFFYELALRPHVAAARRADAVLATWLHPDAVAAARLAARAGRPLWIKLHGGDVLHLSRPLARDRILRACHAAKGLLGVSRQICEQLVAHGLPPGRIHWLPNGIDTERFHVRDRFETRRRLNERTDQLPPEFLDKGRIALFVGRFVGLKDILTLLDAWHHLLSVPGQRPEPVRLVLAGDGPLRPHLERRVAELHRTDTIAFIGYRPHDEVALWMNAADCLCLASTREGMPNVVLEALSSGLPAICTVVGEIPWLIREGVNGYSIPRSDAGLARRYGEAVDLALSRTWDANAVSATVRHLSWDATADLFFSLLRSEAETPGGGPPPPRAAA